MLQYVGQYHGISHAVCDAIHAAHGMCDGVDVSDVGIGDGYAGIVGTEEKVLSSLDVLPVLVGGGHILDDQPYGFFCALLCFLGCEAVDVSLDCVRECIHGCCCGDVLGQRQRQGGVEDGILRYKAEIDDGMLVVIRR